MDPLFPDDRAAAPPRIDRASPEYRKAFEAYLRYGEPIELNGGAGLEGKAGGVSEDRPTTHYIWRTRGDGKVRSSHAANDGRIFAWDDPPPTGHPGEDYGCRCWAEPYIPVAYSAPDTQEFFNITLQDVSDEGPPWGHQDFVRHYFFGEGRTVTVRKTGHLRAVVAEFMRQAGDVPTRLPGQIADYARTESGRSFEDSFEAPYNMTDIVFSLGKTNIGGPFKGTRKNNLGLLYLRGTIKFKLDDWFRDPVDIEEHVLQKIGAEGMVPIELPGATPYRIVDHWGGVFDARVSIDRSQSKFFYVPPR
ncbi:MAG: phage minor head protein [Pseudomonadota bacterium]